MLTLVLTVAGACTSVSAGGGAPMGVSLAGGRGIAHRGIQGGGCVAATERGVWGIGAKGSLGERGMDEDGLNMMRLRGGKAVSRSMSKYSMMGIPMSISNKFGMSVVERKSVSDIKEKLAAELKDVAKRNPELFSEERILRFLRSYEHDVEKTVEKMREMLAWRQKHDTDVIRALVTKHYNEDFWQMPCIPRRDFFRKMYLMEPNYKVTKEGDLVSVEYTGAIDIRAFMTQATEHEIIRFWCFLMEWNMIKLSTLSKRYGKIVRMVQVKDLYGQNLWQCTVSARLFSFLRHALPPSRIFVRPPPSMRPPPTSPFSNQFSLPCQRQSWARILPPIISSGLRCSPRARDSVQGGDGTIRQAQQDASSRVP